MWTCPRLPRAFSATLLGAAACLGLLAPGTNAQVDKGGYAIVIHGGAGTITRDNMTDQLESQYRTKLAEALLAGQTALEVGKPGLDAAVAVITILEDSPLFNAGKGAVFTADGRNELDASIMDGATLNAGAIAGVTRVRNPILLARAVMEKSKHVMLSGTGAEDFAREVGIELVSPLYFHTERRFNQLLRARQRQQGAVLPPPSDPLMRQDEAHKFGTVGVVILDTYGNLTAATSTGGTTNKQYGRIGDTPVIGAGTYADNASCAVSATGTGEFFIRATVARDVCALMEYKGMKLQAAADEVIFKKMGGLGGDGGIIAVDKNGNMAYSFNTAGMYRARVSSTTRAEIGIYKND